MGYVLNSKSYVKYKDMFVEFENALDAFDVLFSSFFGIALHFPPTTGSSYVLIQRTLYGIKNPSFDQQFLTLRVLDLEKSIMN